MPNTKDLQPAKNLSILVVGDSGTRKTRFAASCPKPFIFDFDKGMASTVDMAVEYETFRDAPRYAKPPFPEGVYPFGTAWPKFITKLNEIGAMIDKGTCPYETLVFDSLTLMGEAALNHQLSIAKHDAPTRPDWGAQIGFLKTVIGQLTSWPLLKVLTAHVQRDTNEITQTVEKLPLITGKFAGMVPVFFDEVYFTEPSKDGKGYSFITSPTPNIRQAKSRRNVPNGTPAEWAKLGPILQVGGK